MSDTRTSDPGKSQPVSGATPKRAVLSGYVQDLLGPVQALMRTLARVSLEPELTLEQRVLVSSLTAEIEVFGRRAGELLHPPKLPPSHPVVSGGEVPTILIVDDDPVWLDAVRELMSREFHVLSACDGLEAADIMLRDRPEVVICDLSMPRTGGLALLEVARSREETSDIPVMILSAAADTDTKIRAFSAGASDYLTKPVALAELIARTRNAIAHARALWHERQLQETDDLTGLANRRALRNFLTGAIRYAAASRRPLAVAMVDQDRLKQINDLHGHAAGDAALRAVAQALRDSKRSSDCAARYGGDEFCVVMPGTDRAGAEKLVARIQEELAAHPIFVSGVPVEVSASFGLACLSEVAWDEPWDDLLARADHALYEQKRARHTQRLARAADAFFESWPQSASAPQAPDGAPGDESVVPGRGPHG